MVSQPDQQELTFEQRVEIQRVRDIERALADGDPELAEFLRIVEYEEVSPEERIEIDRALEAARNQTEWEEPDTFLKEWREEDPEFVDMLDRLDEQFPDWSQLMFRLPEDHPEDFVVLRALESREPEAAKFLCGIHAELRFDLPNRVWRREVVYDDLAEPPLSP